MSGLKKKVAGEFIEIGPPIPAEPNTVLTADDDRKIKWSKPQSTFRGEWAPDSLAWVSDFSAGIPNPPYSDVSVSAGTGFASTADSNVPPNQPYLNSARVRVNTVSGRASRSYLRLDLSALKLKNITRFGFWNNATGEAGTWKIRGQSVVLVDDVLVWSKTTSESGYATWVKNYFPISPGAEALYFGIGSATDNVHTHGARYAGIEIYVTDQPYMLGDFVTYQGEMWKSLINNNAQTPSKTSTSWVKALTLPSPTGTTAQRPTPSIAGVGYLYYDTTLGRPIWSTGTTWIDSSGVVV